MSLDFHTKSASGNNELFHNETIELLRSEIAQLEQELVERDARLAELSVTARDDSHQQPSAEEAPDTVALVSRLEQLLDELERKDQREASLQEMLRAAEEANRAEQEERQQIESWLNEIEHRIGQREAEWQAANDELRQRVQKVTEERDQVERALEAGAPGTGNSEPPHESHSNLRQRVSELEHQLGEKEKQIATLKGRLAHPESSTVAPVAESKDKAVREERLQIAHERAELARQRAELEHEKRGLDRGPSEVDQRVQALRDHLREIHERQEIEQKERQQHGLAGRIARLWKRLEG